MSVKRYEWVACDEHSFHCDVVESAEGDMVDYEDYAAIEARCAALAAENAGLKAGASCLVSEYMMNKGTDSEFIACITPSKKTIGTGGAWDMWRYLEMALNTTPATDAFLAEVRAQGVDLVCDYHKSRCEALRDVDRNGSQRHGAALCDAIDIAYQIRKGVQS